MRPVSVSGALSDEETGRLYHRRSHSAVRASCRPRGRRRPKINKSVVKIFANPALAGPLQTLGQVVGSGGDRFGSRDRRQTDLDQRPRGQHASQIFVQFDKSGEKLASSVVAVAPGIDLAVLKLDDESALRRPPSAAGQFNVARRSAGRLRLRLSGRGIGTVDHAGDRLADRIRGLLHRSSRTANPDRCRDQPGNSGGPVVAEGKLIGIAFSRLEQVRQHRLHHPHGGNLAVPQGH